MQQRIVPLLKRCHKEVPRHLRGPALAFWVFHVLRDYSHTLAEAGHRLAPRLGEWAKAAARLEARVGPIELVFGHNDLLAANLIDDGRKLWLVDWDYAGFNSPALRPRRPRLQQRARRTIGSSSSRPISTARSTTRSACRARPC
jgi:thiamine kinase-like enzyme